MFGGRRVANFTLAATSTGTGTKQTSVLDPTDLSRARQLEATLSITAAASTSSDLLDVYVQDSDDAAIWNDRVHFQVKGNQSASATAPFRQRAVITSAISLQSPEKVYTETGGASGADIPVGTVVNGPFPPPYRGGTTTGTRASTWRVLFVQTDSSGSASFTGSVEIRAHDQDIV
jgi:hypothetical protein